MFSSLWMERVVPVGMVTVVHDGSAATFKNAGASSDPLAVSVHVPDALALRGDGETAAKDARK